MSTAAAGCKQHTGTERPHCRADPEAPIDDEVDASAIACRDQFLDRRVDRRVLPADSGAGEKTEDRKVVKSQEKAVNAVASR